MATLNKRFADYRRNAATRELAFNLTIGEFDVLTQGTCQYCGATKEESTIGVDRIDSSIGYEAGNVQPCCTFCNKMKSNFGEEKFLKQIARINAFRNVGK